MSLKAEATEAGSDVNHGPPDAGEAGHEVERVLQPGVVGVGLIGSESSLGVVVNLDKVSFRPFRKSELSHGGPQRVAARQSARLPWSPR